MSGRPARYGAAYHGSSKGVYTHDERLAKGQAGTGWLRLDLTHSQKRYARVLEPLVKPGTRWLEAGCGRHIIPYWALPEEEQREMVARCQSLTGIDADGALREHALLTHRVYGLGGGLPFREGVFDLVSANMVVEHVSDCRGFLTDVYRVLKPGGCFVFHTPNYWYYLIFIASLTPDLVKEKLVWWLEGRHDWDVFPTYYRMNTASNVRRAANASGFTVESLQLVSCNGQFGRLGPIGVLECFILKLSDSAAGGRFRSNLICVLRKPAESPSHP